MLLLEEIRGAPIWRLVPIGQLFTVLRKKFVGHLFGHLIWK
jgi:hypothetical protein